jgi:LPS-assembly protein
MTPPHPTTKAHYKNCRKLPSIGSLNSFGDPYFLAFILLTPTFTERKGLRGQRLALFPELSIPKNLFGRAFYSNLVFENLYYFGLNQQGYKQTVSSLYFSESVPFIIWPASGEL